MYARKTENAGTQSGSDNEFHSNRPAEVWEETAPAASERAEKSEGNARKLGLPKR